MRSLDLFVWYGVVIVFGDGFIYEVLRERERLVWYLDFIYDYERERRERDLFGIEWLLYLEMYLYMRYRYIGFFKIVFCRLLMV